MTHALRCCNEVDVAIAGGGPAGSTVAGLLAQRGRRVVLFEAERFPRYHIGESLIPGAVPVLKALGVWERVDRHGFVQKRGNTYVWGQQSAPWSIAFAEADITAYAYQVVRSEFDAILLRHARASGADVRENHTVQKVLWSGTGRAEGFVVTEPSGRARSIRAAWVVDATGQRCLIGRHLDLRRRDPLLNNVAVWSYFRRAERLPEPTSGYTLSASIPEGWIWYIPLHDGTTSVGIVIGAESLRGVTRLRLGDAFSKCIATSEMVSSLLRHASRAAPFRTVRDWSYRCERFAGPGWLLVGDAAGFVDPILSTGCGLALQAGHAAARALDAAVGGADEREAMTEYERFYQAYIGQFFDFVHYFYDANRHLDSYFWQARRLTRPARNSTARSAFIYLIAGLSRASIDATALGRSFEMGVFENLGTPLGTGLLEASRRALSGPPP
jgi:halogenation protein CepH